MTISKEDIATAVENWEEKVDRAYRQFMDVELLLLLERVGPEQRLMFYGTVDFDALRSVDVALWQKMTADAMALEEKRQVDEQARQKEYERQTFVDTKLLRQEMYPFGKDDELGMAIPPEGFR